MSRVCAETPADRSRRCVRGVYEGNKTQKSWGKRCGHLSNDSCSAPTKAPSRGREGPVQKASLGPSPGSGCGPDLPYSSRMILSTLRTMLPTVVSEGCAAVILRPSLRISSISSPTAQKEKVRARSARRGAWATFRLGIGIKKGGGLPHLHCSSGGP